MGPPDSKSHSCPSSEAQGIVEQRQAVLTPRVWEETKTVVYATQF